MSNVLTGNIQNIEMIAITLDPASVAANTTAEQVFTIPGLRAGDMVVVNKPTTTAGISVGDSGVTSANQLAITFGNHTAGALNPPSEIYTILVFRSDSPGPFPSGLPNAVMF